MTAVYEPLAGMVGGTPKAYGRQFASVKRFLSKVITVVTELEIQCINKSDRYDPHERILAVGGHYADGSRWKFTLMEALLGIQTGTLGFFTKGGGKIARVEIAHHFGRSYLKTENDGVQPDNLLALPECP